MAKRFRVRPECFGATVYDSDTLGYFFLDHAQLAALEARFPQRAATLPEDRLENPLSADTPDVSGGKFAELLAEETVIHLMPAVTPLVLDALAAPIRVYFELTTRCNASCRYCLNNSGSRRPAELTTEEILRAIANMGREGVFEVRLTGGEPTLRPDFFDIARAVQAGGMTLSVNSSLLIGNRPLAQLCELRPSLLITSLDAAEGPHAEQRGPGFQQIVTHIQQLREASVSVRLNCVLSQATLPFLESFVHRFAPLGCGFCFILIRPVGRADRTFDPPPLPDLLAATARIDELRHVYPAVYFSTSFHVVMEQELIIGPVNLTGCNAIQKSFNVNSDGTVLPCAFLYELDPEAFTLGNIRATAYSVLPFWRHASRLRMLRQQSAECNLRCIACPHFKHDCRGSCVFMALYSRLSGCPDPYCKRSRPAPAPMARADSILAEEA